jgi:hypothetical protein
VVRLLVRKGSAMPRLVVGTVKGLYELGMDGSEPRADDGPTADREVTTLAATGDGLWALVDGTTVLRRDRHGTWTELASASGLTCVLPGDGGLLVGAEPARLLHLEGGVLEPAPSLDSTPGHETWHTPWGGPPAVRSMTRDRAGRLHVNVHVGGIPRSLDGGATWQPTIDVDADVHQVLAHPVLADVVLAATAMGMARSDDGGEHWRFERDGLHADYCRAVAVSGETVLVSASTGPSGRRAAIYRTPLGSPARFERCTAGLPEWFDANVDTGCLAADGETVAFGTADGSLFRSEDAGATWTEAAAGLPAVRAVTFA